MRPPPSQGHLSLGCPPQGPAPAHRRRSAMLEDGARKPDWSRRGPLPCVQSPRLSFPGPRGGFFLPSHLNRVGFHRPSGQLSPVLLSCLLPFPGGISSLPCLHCPDFVRRGQPPRVYWDTDRMELFPVNRPRFRSPRLPHAPQSDDRPCPPPNMLTQVPAPSPTPAAQSGSCFPCPSQGCVSGAVSLGVAVPGLTGQQAPQTSTGPRKEAKPHVCLESPSPGPETIFLNRWLKKAVSTGTILGGVASRKACPKGQGLGRIAPTGLLSHHTERGQRELHPGLLSKS